MPPFLIHHSVGAEGMKAMPWFPFYASDWIGSKKRRMLTHAQRGIYIDMLCECWDTETCDLPGDLTIVARLIDAPIEDVEAVAKLCFTVNEEGNITNPKLFDLWLERKKIYNQNKLNAEKRWGNQAVNADDAVALPPVYGASDSVSSIKNKKKVDGPPRYREPDKHGNERTLVPGTEAVWMSAAEIGEANLFMANAGLRSEYFTRAYQKVDSWFTETATGKKALKESARHWQRVVQFGLREALKDQEQEDKTRRSSNFASNGFSPKEGPRTQPPLFKPKVAPNSKSHAERIAEVERAKLQSLNGKLK